MRKLRYTLYLLLASSLFMASCGDDKSSVNPDSIDDDEDIIQNNEPAPEPELWVDEEEKCTAGQTACDGYVLLTCGSDGKFVHTTCNKNEICKVNDGVASCVKEGQAAEEPVENKCTAGSKQCESGIVMVCDESGKWTESINCLASGQTCSDEDKDNVKCVASSVDEPEKECEAGETRCDGDKLLKCSDSFVFVEESNCADDGSGVVRMCSESAGVASCVETCTNGFTRCHDDVLQTCNENGQYEDTTQCQDSDQICGYDGGNAACIDKPSAPECTTGETGCTEEKWIKTCVGGVWNTSECPLDHECQVDSVSSVASCVVVPCEDGATKCSERGNKLMTCVGGAWTETKCLEQKMICDVNPEPVNGLDKAACVEPTTSGETAETIDSDADTIPDKVEGIETNRDTDGDGTPDYMDLDSDDDTIPDKVEANNGGMIAVPPEDADYDGIPNYIDDDSDNNGIPDSQEACPGASGTCDNPVDTDGDGSPDYLDYDNDGDGFSDVDEIRGLIAVSPKPEDGKFSGVCGSINGVQGGTTGGKKPLDCDGDGTPDYMDTDSDNDKLSDKFEGFMMKDGIYTRYEKDADRDGRDDCLECTGNTCTTLVSNTTTTCIDSDDPKDGVPDMLETDSDGDGIPDKVEIALGSNPTKKDSDNDDAPDIVEYAICQLDNKKMDCSDNGIKAGKCQCDAINNEKLNPQSEGNFVFTTPYEEDTTPRTQVLGLETGIQTVDMYFNFDGSGTMVQEVASLKSNLKTIINTIKCADLGRACTDNKDCDGIANAMCSEQGRCILSPSADIDYNKTCSSDADCNTFSNATCKKEGTSTTGRCKMAGCIADMETGLGWYSSDSCFRSVVPMSNSVDATVNALDGFPNDAWGFDEPPYQMPICAIMGNEKFHGTQYCNTNACNCAPRDSGSTCVPRHQGPNCVTGDPNRETCIGYRKSAIKIYLQVFDEEQCKDNTTNPKLCSLVTNDNGSITGAVMSEHKVRWIGLYSTCNCSTGRLNDMKTVSDNIGIASGSVRADGTPFSYYAMDANLSNNVRDGVLDVVRSMPMDVTATVEDIDENAYKLVEELKIKTSGHPTMNDKLNCFEVPNNTIVRGKTSRDDQPNDKKFKYDGVNSLTPGKLLCYDVVAVNKQSIFNATNTVQVKKARVKVMGDGSVLNSGIAYFVIPPKLEGSNE